MSWQAGVVPFDGDEINRETALRWLGDLWEILAVTHGGMTDEDQVVRAAFGRLLRELGQFTEAIRTALEDGEVFQILDDLDDEQRQAGAVVLEPELLEVARVAFEPLYDSNVLVRHAACSLLGDLRDVVQAAVKAIETGDPIDLVENEVVPAQLAALAGLLDVHAKEGNPHPRVYAKLSSSLVEMLAAA